MLELDAVQLRCVGPLTHRFPDCGVVLLLGRNGAGKTTLLQVLAGYLQPRTGVVRINGERLHGPDPRVHYLPDQAPLYAELAVREQLQLAAALLGAPRGRATWALAELGLTELGDCAVGRLSLGLRRRVALAQSLLAEQARVLLLDEPTAGLDVVELHAVHERLRQVARTRLVVLATHHLAEAEQLADGALMLDRPGQHRVWTAADGPLLEFFHARPRDHVV